MNHLQSSMKKLFFLLLKTSYLVLKKYIQESFTDNWTSPLQSLMNRNISYKLKKKSNQHITFKITTY